MREFVMIAACVSAAMIGFMFGSASSNRRSAKAEDRYDLGLCEFDMSGYDDGRKMLGRLTPYGCLGDHVLLPDGGIER